MTRIAFDRPLPESFRVYPIEDDTSAYFIVVVSDTLAEMRALMVDLLQCQGADEILACCYAISAEAPYDGLLGMLFFAKERMGSGIVAHELVHAGFRTADACGVHVVHSDRRADASGVEWTNPHEETYADIVETLTKQFWREAYARDIAS